MSDWKSRATSVPYTPSPDSDDSDTGTSDWKSRATALPSSDDPGSLHDALVGLGQGATLGFGDEALGGLQAAKDVITGDTKLEDLGSDYRKHQQENEKSFKDAKSRSPYLTGGGEVIGSLLPAVLTGGLGEAGEVANLAKNGAGLRELTTGAAQAGAKLAPIGALAGAGGSEGTTEQAIQDLTQGKIPTIAKDTAFGGGAAALLGTGANIAGKGASAVVDKLGAMAADSPLVQKLLYAFKGGKDGQSFTGTKAGTDIQDTLNNISNSVTGQVQEPINQARELYGQMLQSATDKGAQLPTDTDLVSLFKAAQDRYKGGLNPEMESLLNKYGTSKMDPNTLQTITNSLNPQEAKSLQNALRGLTSKPSYDNASEISNLINGLTPAINSTLPEGELAQANNIYKNAASVAEPFINKGETNPDIQKKLLSDLDPDAIGNIVNSYTKKLIGNLQDSNKNGDEARSQLQNIIGRLKQANESAGAQLTNPDQISNQITNASFPSSIRKGIYGEKAGDSMGIPDGIVNAVTGAPYRVAQATGKIAGTASDVVESSRLPELGRNIYRATDDALQGAAQSLKAAGHDDIASSLSNALQNKNDNLKNATLFTIMQNPQYRQAVFGQDQDKQQNQ